LGLDSLAWQLALKHALQLLSKSLSKYVNKYRIALTPYLNIPFKMSSKMLVKAFFFPPLKNHVSQNHIGHPYSLITLARANVAPSHRMGSSNSHEGEKCKFTVALIY